MSELTDRYAEAAAARFKDLAPKPEALPEPVGLLEFEANLRAHHECPAKRVGKDCNCAFND